MQKGIMDMHSDEGERVPIRGASAALSLHPQTLRKYERAGLLRPARRSGGSRHYSEADLARLELIKHMADVRRINVAGMGLALSLWDELSSLLGEMEAMDHVDAGRLARDRLAVILARFTVAQQDDRER
ncbi:hypothetical protein AYO38_05310 [bacterium SCGC AG-212-C10]|nr:hypothetical protein AYO38_05310 [bacterium SCGC AG-212-C10]